MAVAADRIERAPRRRTRRAGPGAARLGGRARREEPRGDLERAVSPHPASALSGLDAARPRLRGRGQSPVAGAGRRRLPGGDAGRRHPGRGGAPAREVRRRLRRLRAPARPAERPALQLGPGDRQSGAPRRGGNAGRAVASPHQGLV